jgi:acyl dehydratase
MVEADGTALADTVRLGLRDASRLMWDALRLPYAVRPSDELDLETTVLEMRESKSKPDRGIVLTRVLMRSRPSSSDLPMLIL